MIQFPERIRNTRILLEPWEHIYRGFGAGFAVRSPRLGSNDANRCSMPGRLAFVDVERADTEGNHFGGKRLCGREAGCRPSIQALLLLDLSAVGKRFVAGRHADRNVPWRLEARLVEAWKHAPRLDRSEGCIDVPVTIDLAAVSAEHLMIVNSPLIRDGEGCPA